ncbi:Precursor of CEP [Heracleum sosnowskyi]|uniref:Precursor of CEP n=1 Tax=Heracleum sosnowskyi TaxID=360622 RepID=A0AAD8GMR2_9APIA|nr:Precursor of CEP [Heracleum sosnowskyi]
MTRSSFVFILYLVTLASFVTSIHARWLNDNMHEIKKQKLPQPPPSARDSLFLSSLPKGSTVPYSAPTKKGHSLIVDDEKLIARHLAAIDRILRSVPSPGVGN